MTCLACPSFFIARDFNNDLGLKEDPPRHMLELLAQSQLPSIHEASDGDALIAGNLGRLDSAANSSKQKAADVISVLSKATSVRSTETVGHGEHLGSAFYDYFNLPPCLQLCLRRRRVREGRLSLQFWKVTQLATVHIFAPCIRRAQYGQITTPSWRTLSVLGAYQSILQTKSPASLTITLTG